MKKILSEMNKQPLQELLKLIIKETKGKSEEEINDFLHNLLKQTETPSLKETLDKADKLIEDNQRLLKEVKQLTKENKKETE